VTTVAEFQQRCLGLSEADRAHVRAALGFDPAASLVERALPEGLRSDPPALPPPVGEAEVLGELRALAARNRVHRSLIGVGYYRSLTPPVIQRLIWENPAWYTAYTPYQPEISQGRLEALFVFQTMLSDLTGLPVANASLLDEATAAAEAMALAARVVRSPRPRFAVDADIFPQVRAVLETRAEPLGIELVTVDVTRWAAGSAGTPGVGAEGGGGQGVVPGSGAGDGGGTGPALGSRGDDGGEPDVTTGPGGAGPLNLCPPDELAGCCGLYVQQLGLSGRLIDVAPVAAAVHAAGGLVVVGADPLALALLRPPGEQGADIAVGSTQRFGLPLGFGGPSAAYLAVRADLVRQVPGRLVGLTRDAHGDPALRLALVTREQHIRREKATSNICTAQVLPAVMAAAYAIYHGPDGLRAIARRVHGLAAGLAQRLTGLGLPPAHAAFFDTLALPTPGAARAVRAAARRRGLDVYADGADRVLVSVDEATTAVDVEAVVEAVAEALARPRGGAAAAQPLAGVAQAPEATSVGIGAPREDTAGGGEPPDSGAGAAIPEALRRVSPVLTHPVFQRYHTEVELTRYLTRLARRDYALDHGMIPLGSCTMKLNPAVTLAPLTWPELADLHPLAPAEDAAGTLALIGQLGDWLAEITGYDACTVQPNAGSQGEYTGLLAIRRYHRDQGHPEKTVCLVPVSAHGTNPASAAMAGFRVVEVATDDAGDVSLDDLRAKLAEFAGQVGALMITYPSTNGVYEQSVRQVCDLVHAAGGQVYIDGANFNALVGWAKAGQFGGDVSHLNLHKTFSLPHGGGGPGVGPVVAKAHLAPYLPGLVPAGDRSAAETGVVGEVVVAEMTEVSARPEGDAVGTRGRAAPGAALGHEGPDDPPAVEPGSVAGARYGSALLLPAAWAYLRLLGGEGLKQATEGAVLAANHVAWRLEPAFPVLYRGAGGLVAHECLLDLRDLTRRTGVTTDDVAKRLMDFGFHAPTMAFPVAGTFMVEPTESESLEELDRFCDAMLAIADEAEKVAAGEWALADSPPRRAPHTVAAVTADDWALPYPRRLGAYPSGSTVDKYWPPVGRVDASHGDRHFVGRLDAGTV